MAYRATRGLYSSFPIEPTCRSDWPVPVSCQGIPCPLLSCQPGAPAADNQAFRRSPHRFRSFLESSARAEYSASPRRGLDGLNVHPCAAMQLIHITAQNNSICFPVDLAMCPHQDQITRIASALTRDL